MGKRAVERRLRRQARKGGLKPRTMQKLMNKSIRMGPPPTPEPKTVMVKQGGKVEPYQDQVMRKFGGGIIKAKQGYNARLDESLSARQGKKSQSLKSRRHESEAMKKKKGKGKFSGARTMS